MPTLFDADGGITIGPIPAGIPVNLLANLQPCRRAAHRCRRREHVGDVLKLLVQLKLDLAALPDERHATSRSAPAFANSVPTAAGAEQVPGLRGESRPLLRHRPGRPTSRR